mgnify:CR=1 FL=1
MKKQKVFLCYLLVVFSITGFFFKTDVQSMEIDWRQFEGITLNILGHQRPWSEGLQRLLPEFEKLTGIRIEQDLFAENTALQRIAVELATHSSAYDLVFSHVDRIPQYAEAEWIEPLDQYIENKNLTDDEYLDLSDFIQSTTDAFRYKEKLYGLPYFAGTVIMYYRNDVFQNYGIQKPPDTFDELLEVCKKIHTKELPAIALRGQPAIVGNLWHWRLFLYGMGGNFFKNYPEDLTPILDQPEAIKALEIYCELMQKYSIPGAASATYDDVVIAMQQGKVAIALEGGPLGGRILDPTQSKVVGKLGFYLVPGGPAGRFPPFSAHGYSIPSGSKNKEAAWLFLQWATSKDTMLKIALVENEIAISRNSAWTNEEFIKKYDYDFGAGSFLEAFYKSLQIAPFWYSPVFEQWPEVGDKVALAVSEAVVGTKSPQQALSDANKEIMDILKRTGI